MGPLNNKLPSDLPATPPADKNVAGVSRHMILEHIFNSISG
jgi:hypothetical protein